VVGPETDPRQHRPSPGSLGLATLSHPWERVDGMQHQSDGYRNPL
jgi:hypothetical protein